jgi:hypothetical protein
MKNFRLLSLVLFAMTMTLLLIPLFGVIPSTSLGVGITCLYWLPGEAGVLGMNNTNNFSARDSYRIAKELLYNAMRNDPKFGEVMNNRKGDSDCRDWVNSRKFSQSEIRLEVKLNAVNNSFVFGLTANQQNSSNVIFNTENRLTMQDTLICNEYGFFVGNPTSQIDTTWELKTYGNPITFAAGTDADLLNTTLYCHGYFRMTCNNDVIIPYRGLFNHWLRPETQQTAAFGAGSPLDQIRGAEDGFITEEPNLLLIGSKGYIPQIVLPSNMALTATQIRAVLLFKGDLAQNSTSVS